MRPSNKTRKGMLQDYIVTYEYEINGLTKKAKHGVHVEARNISSAKKKALPKIYKYHTRKIEIHNLKAKSPY